MTLLEKALAVKSNSPNRGNLPIGLAIARARQRRLAAKLNGAIRRTYKWNVKINSMVLVQEMLNNGR